MPTESDHRLDPLLRAYAAQRREDAGEPLELHPARRRLLQGEVARRRPKVSRSQWLGFLSGPLLWPRVSLVGSSLVLAGVLAWVWAQSLPTPDKTRIAQHKSIPPPGAAAASPALLRGALDANSLSLEGTLTSKAPAPAPAQAPAIAGNFQVSTDQPVPPQPDLGTNPEAAPRLLPTNLPVAYERGARHDESAWRTVTPLSATSRFRYQRIDQAAPVQNDRAASASRAGGAQPGLLTSFELEQWEQRVRILDADGSVYEGSLVNGELPNEKAGVRLLPARTGNAEARPEAPDAQGLALSEADGGTVTFRVSGTNRSLNQWVVINGTLGSPAAEIGLSFGANPEASRVAVATPTSSPAPVVTAAPLLLKSVGRSPAQIAPSSAAGVSAKASVEASDAFPFRLRGTAIIAGTNELRIEALRVTK